MSGEKLRQDSSAGKSVFSTIEEVVADMRAGKMVIIVDDENRENEGDLYGSLWPRSYLPDLESGALQTVGSAADGELY
jgi:3,4-dihydroxy-2-butanone 4-phosphate synthase